MSSVQVRFHTRIFFSLMMLMTFLAVERSVAKGPSEKGEEPTTPATEVIRSMGEISSSKEEMEEGEDDVYFDIPDPVLPSGFCGRGSPLAKPLDERCYWHQA